jgi:two-component system, LytTR family, sensor kinase
VNGFSGVGVLPMGNKGAEGSNCVEIALGVVFGAVVVASMWAASRFISSPGTVLSEEGQAMRAALHAATATLPHLRRGLTQATASKAAPHLRALTQCTALALANRETLLALEGSGAVRALAGSPIATLFEEGPDDRVHVDPRMEMPELHLGGAVVAPLIVRGKRVGSLAAFYARGSRIRPEDTRVVGDAAQLVSAQLELAAVEEQEERLARAELRALRAQISPHFIYNALAAVASYIHTRPDEARELLTEFAEFTRYAFRGRRAHVTLADELHYVEKYLRLEQARFGDRLQVRVEVAPEVLGAVVPVLSLQPLVENAVRHGIEAGRPGVRVEIVGRDLGVDVELRVCDDGAGMDPGRAAEALDGRAGGIGLSNVHGRLQSTFGPEYGLRVESEPGRGTTVVLFVPKFRAGVRAA